MAARFLEICAPL